MLCKPPRRASWRGFNVLATAGRNLHRNSPCPKTPAAPAQSLGEKNLELRPRGKEEAAPHGQTHGGPNSPHILLCTNYQIVLLERLKEFLEEHFVRSMVHTAHQDVVHKSKSCIPVPEGLVHVALDRSHHIPQTKRQPLVVKQTKGSGDGCLENI